MAVQNITKQHIISDSFKQNWEGGCHRIPGKWNWEMFIKGQKTSQ